MKDKKEFDFIIVGQGIAGTILSFNLLKRNKSFLVIDSIKSSDLSSSKIALGVYNPLVLKWITKSWKADDQIKDLFNFCDIFENFFNKKIHYKRNIHRLLKTSYEINNWKTKNGFKKFKNYMSSELQSFSFSKELFGVVLKSGWVDVSMMLDVFLNFLKSKGFFLNQKFNYNNIIFENDIIFYQDIKCKYIVFCEGCFVSENPFFNDLNIIPTKGETLKIHSPKLKLNNILHTGVLIIPLGDDIYHIGSTFDSKDLSFEKTENARKKLIDKLPFLKNIEHQIIEHNVSHRPSTIDRKPILGSYKNHKNVFLLNGLGSRGVLHAPYLSKQLIDFIFEEGLIDPEISINRFK